MTPREIILAFLAARYPAAFGAAPITARLNATGLLDAPISTHQVITELTTLAHKFNAVECDIDRISGTAAWTATTEGVQQWHLSGQLYVGM